MQNLKTSTDASKLNKKPERIRVKTVTSAGTGEQVLRKLNVPAERLTELAILNGINLTDRIEQGTMIKVYGQ